MWSLERDGVNIYVDETRGPVHINESAIIGHGVVLIGPLRIGRNVKISPYCVIGGEAEHLGRATDHGPSITIRQGCVLREHVVVQRSVVGGVKMSLGPYAYIMHGCHIAHDCNVGEWARLSPYTVLGGHTTVGPRVNMGINSGTHPGVILGCRSMVGGGAFVTKHVPPGSTVAGVPAKWVKRNERGLVNCQESTMELMWRAFREQVAKAEIPRGVLETQDPAHK